jgi:archaellum component FlaG (FlaF/FlaG flagellin family)
MKTFLMACIAAVIFAAFAVGILDKVQQPVAQAFATSAVRL